MDFESLKSFVLQNKTYVAVIFVVGFALGVILL